MPAAALCWLVTATLAAACGGGTSAGGGRATVRPLDAPAFLGETARARIPLLAPPTESIADLIPRPRTAGGPERARPAAARARAPAGG